MQFSKVIGQDRIKKKLVAAVKAGRVSHAQMLISQEGNGGLALALAYATYLSCTNKGDDDSCGSCPSCKKYAKLEHPDLHLFFPNNTTTKVKKASSGALVKEWRKSVLEDPYLNQQDWLHSVDIGNKQGILGERDSAEIVATTNLKKYESDYRIVVIWMAEKMNQSCSNKILKVIEEPPRDTVFLLVTEDPEVILPTILSRVQSITLELLSEDQISANLVSEHMLDLASAKIIAHKVNGNYRLAKKLAHSGDVEDLNAFFIKWMRLCFSNNAPEILALADEFHGLGRETQKDWLDAAAGMLRIASLHGLWPEVDLPDDQSQFIRKFSGFLNADVSMAILNLIDQASQQIARNAYAKMVLTDTSFSIGDLLRQKVVS